MSGVRHFTATGFVICDERVLLHWHPKVKAWLPPGGHINENEDPVQAVLREIQEETGICAEVVSMDPPLRFQYPSQLPSPITIMIEDIRDPESGYHQHIDMIYFCRPIGPPGALKEGWVWVKRVDIIEATPLTIGGAHAEPPPEDVRLLALKAFDAITEMFLEGDD